MILKAYSILDMGTGAYAAPFFVHADAVALRFAFQLSLDPNGDYGKYTSDFALYRIGEYDNQVGQMYSCPPINLGSLASISARMRAQLSKQEVAAVETVGDEQ